MSEMDKIIQGWNNDTGIPEVVTRKAEEAFSTIYQECEENSEKSMIWGANKRNSTVHKRWKRYAAVFIAAAALGGTVFAAKYKLIFYDTLGQEKYKSIAPNLIKKANGIILMYDITNQSSFDSLPEIIKNIKEERGNDFPMILVGNKADLEQDREIKKEQGEDLAFKNEMGFFEVSNKEGTNIEEAGLDIVNKILEKRKEESIVNESDNNTRLTESTYNSKYSNIDNDASNRGRCC